MRAAHLSSPTALWWCQNIAQHDSNQVSCKRPQQLSVALLQLLLQRVKLCC
jgi:hypothetical protein